MYKKTFLFCIFVLSSMLSYAQYGGGTGTEANPYQIKTVEHLAELATTTNAGTNYIDVHFKLMTDLDFAGWAKTPVDDTGWEPIGIEGRVKK
jgi:hypothetical protein